MGEIREVVFGGLFVFVFYFGDQIRASCGLEGVEKGVPQFRNKQ